MNKTIDYRVVVGIDFGTTYSGFAYAHKKNPRDITVHTDWQEYSGRYKTPTALSYDEEYKNVQSWGFPALAKKPSSNKRRKEPKNKPVELFKLHLGKMSNKPPLPKGFDYKKAITDYLQELGNVIKKSINDKWNVDDKLKVDFYTQVLIVLTIPAEFDDNAMMIIRECAFKAGLLRNQYSRNLKFTTEPEAAAVHCMKSLKEHNLSVGASFMVVDCGGGTVDLTTRQLLDHERISEIAERNGDYCGGSYVDQEFLKFLERKVGSAAIKLVKEKQYGQLQYVVQEFCRTVKMKFTGIRSEFQPVDFELDEICPILTRYCEGRYLDDMEEAEWNIRLEFEDVKAMFDPVVDRILRLVDSQLRLSDNCSALILVGGFSESKYLQSRIKQKFSTKTRLISIPPQPVTAIIKGAVQYGLREEVVFSRVLKWSYGTDVARGWKRGDPESRKRIDGRIITYSRLAKRGTQVSVDEAITRTFYPCSLNQRKMGLNVYVTPQDDAKFCDDDDVKLLGKWSVDLPLSLNIKDRAILYTLKFGSVEIEVTAVNNGTGDKYETTLELDL